MKKAKLYKRIVTVILFSALTLAACEAKAGPKKVYKLPIISDVKTVVSTSKLVSANKRSVQLTLLYETRAGKPIPYILKAYSPRYVEEMIQKTSVVMDSFLKERGVTIEDCRGSKYNLIVTVVSNGVLQDNVRFRNFYKTKFGVEKLAGRTLYGYYDSTPEIQNNSSILITDVGAKLNKEVLAHELAHYWWDRMCVGAKVSGTSEAFAQAFDQYYLRSVAK